MLLPVLSLAGLAAVARVAAAAPGSGVGYFYQTRGAAREDAGHFFELVGRAATGIGPGDREARSPAAAARGCPAVRPEAGDREGVCEAAVRLRARRWRPDRVQIEFAPKS